jgi:glutaredoxin
LEIVVYGARWCPKCRDIVNIVAESSLRCTGVLLDDSSEDVARLRKETSANYVPAIKIGEKVVFGYYPKQLSILLGTMFKARDHPHHTLAKG